MTVINIDRTDHPPGKLPAAAAQAFFEMRDPKVLCAAGGHAGVLDGLLQLATCGRSGIGMLTGAPGLGKTLIRSALAQRAAAHNCDVVSLETSLLSFDDALLEILSQMTNERVLPADLPTRYERMAQLKTTLISKIVSQGRHLLILVDDAEQLDTEMLDAIGSLNNLCSERQSFVVPILFGHEALAQKLARSPALRQRIGAHYTLAPLSLEQCRAYIQHRLGLFDLREPDVFAAGAVERIHSLSGGIPRLVNALCRHAIRAANAHAETLVTAAIADECRPLVFDAGIGLASPGTSLSPLQIGR
jgi:general secretion pathway protein A